MGIRPSILVNIDRPRQLRFSTNGMIAAEELAGIDLLSIDTNAKKVKISEMRAIIFAALWEDDETLTLNKAGELADNYEGGLGALFGKAAEAISLAFDGGDEKNAKRLKAAKPKAEDVSAQENS